MDEIIIYCKNIDRSIGVEPGTSLAEIYRRSSISLPYPMMCAKVNNQTRPLEYRVYNPKNIEFIDLRNPSGMRTYVRSLCFVLYKAVSEVIPDKRLRIEHPVSKGLFCTLGKREEITQEQLAAIKERMRAIIAADLRFIPIEKETKEVIEEFEKRNMTDKVSILSSSTALYTTYYQLGDTIDFYYSVLLPSTGHLTLFDLVVYEDGMLLVLPNEESPDRLNEVLQQPKMLEAFRDYVHFNHIAGLSNVGNLNASIKAGGGTGLIQVTEALHEKKIAHIADEIASRKASGGARIVLISGPSSSGKTTFSKRLSVQLMTNLIRPVAISLDNYFVDRTQTPLDEEGEYDYESLYALDLPLFNDHLTRLLAGEEVALPTYNFEHGYKTYKGDKLKLGIDSVLILEGIHALNPELTAGIDDALKYRVYVSALTCISLDDHNWIPISDNRLLRRIIRDSKYRGSSAEKTIARWASVRRGESKWIFPYQENADAMFNSALLFELSVVKNHAVPILREVPRTSPQYSEAHRLLNFLDYIVAIPERSIPPTSLLREFLGGSSFKY